MCDYKSFLPFAMDAIETTIVKMINFEQVTNTWVNMDMIPYNEIEEFGCAHV
jgi:hypothetical protein